MQKLINIGLLFFLIFGFKLPILNSTYLAGGIAFFLLIFKQGEFSYIINLFKNKYVFNLLILTALMAPLAIIISGLHVTYDFSLAKQVASQLPVLISCLFVFSIIFPTLNNENELLQLLIEVFLIQSVIILLAFISPSVLGIVEFFQYENDNLLDQSSVLRLFQKHLFCIFFY
mgnify:CR=1 FL=1